MIWFTSDTHFFHNRDFLYEPRGFNSVEEMNEAIIQNWNSVVDYDDDVYILGDIMLNDNERGLHCLSRLNGHIHIIRGNHDSDGRMELYQDSWNVVEVCEGKFFKYEGYHFYLSHYPTLTSNLDEDKPLKRRMINLCGHSHSKDKWCDWNKGIIYHCELDAHNCYPISIEQILKDIKAKMD